ncbi:hypothetical protein ACTXT7_002370 [Hymenolepis weldensis]
MFSTKSPKFIYITPHFLLFFLLISDVFAVQNARSSKKTIFATKGAPFRRELSPKLTETKFTRGNAYPLDFESIQQTPVEPELRLGIFLSFNLNIYEEIEYGNSDHSFKKTVNVNEPKALRPL